MQSSPETGGARLTRSRTEERRPWRSFGRWMFNPWMVTFIFLWLAAFMAFAPEPMALVRQHWVLVLIGVLGAVVGNATSVGGGIVFIPFMMFFYQLDAIASLRLSLVTQAFGMSTGALTWWRVSRGNPSVLSRSASFEGPDLDGDRAGSDLGLLVWLLAGAILGAGFGTVVLVPEAKSVQQVFAWVSIVIGALTLLLLGRSGRGLAVPKRGRLALAFVAAVGGAVSAWAAIGVGEVVAAWLILRWRAEAKQAISVGVVLMATVSVLLALYYQFLGGGLPWDLACFVILGAVIGARLGPVVAMALPDRALKIGFAFVAIGDGLLMLAKSMGS